MSAEQDILAAPVRRAEATAPSEPPNGIDLERQPEAVLSVLEADQLVAAKERAHFAQRPLSGSVRVLLWGLRLYVVAMMVLVVIQVLRAVQGGH